MSLRLTAYTCHCGRVVRCIAASDMTGVYNAALNRPVFSSSVLLNYTDKKFNFVPSLANDGSHETDMAHDGTPRCFHSLAEDNPWWAVDLGQPMCIHQVDFTNRGDCCGMTKSIPAFCYRCASWPIATDWCFCTVWQNTEHEYWIFLLKCCFVALPQHHWH